MSSSIIKKGRETSFPTFSNLFESFFNDDFFGRSNKSATLPAINVHENPKEFKIEVAAPGYEKDEINVEVNSGVLTISAEHKQENEEKDSNDKTTRREFRYSSFERSFTLPQSCNENKISAKYDQGILNVKIQKRDEAIDHGAKKISVN